MPLEPDCADKHRDKKHLGCNTCSDNYDFTISDLRNIETISTEICGHALKLEEWKPHAARLSYTVTLIIHEACLNAVEHGIMGIDKASKRELLDKLGERYLEYVEKEWARKGPSISITACVNAERVLIGIHDAGTGFDPSDDTLMTISDEDILESSGRGMAILKGVGVKLNWNAKGNTILCSYPNPGGPELPPDP